VAVGAVPGWVLPEFARVNARGGRYAGTLLPLWYVACVPKDAGEGERVRTAARLVGPMGAMGGMGGVAGAMEPLLRMLSSAAEPSRSHRYTSPSSDPPAIRLLDGDANAHRIMFLEVFWWPV
jgi:hypothetical protein